MKMKDVRRGMRVRIANDVTQTYKEFGGGATMRGMTGKVYKVGEIRRERNGVLIGNYLWSVKDIEPLKPVKKIEPQLFDPNHLDFS